ncbi:MAG: M23 family metallopeptidase [Pseudomonadota bacterium]
MSFQNFQQLVLVSTLALCLAACSTQSSPNTTNETNTPAPTPREPAPETPPAIAAPPSPKPDLGPASEAASQSVFPTVMFLCPRMTVSNAPTAGPDLKISHYQPTVTINGVTLAVAPVEAGCVSSGFGPRNGRAHKGIDLHSSEPVSVFAAADGRIREKIYRDDYGNMLVIQHADGVFARYAHLESFAGDFRVGDTVESGQVIGIMGNTASYSIPRHLHFEVLTGEWGVMTGAFGLTPVDIFAHLPAN